MNAAGADTDPGRGPVPLRAHLVRPLAAARLLPAPAPAPGSVVEVRQSGDPACSGQEPTPLGAGPSSSWPVVASRATTAFARISAS